MAVILVAVVGLAAALPAGADNGLHRAIRNALVAPAAVSSLVGQGQPGCIGEFQGDGHELACSGMRLAPTGNTYYVGEPGGRDFHLFVVGNVWAKQAYFSDGMTIGDPRDGTGIAFVNGGEIVRGIREYRFGLTGRAYEVLSTSGYAERTGEAKLTRDGSGSVAVVPIASELLAIANVSPRSGGYFVTTLVCSAACTSAPWWSKAESTETRIVVRSSDPNATSFVYTIRAVRAEFTRESSATSEPGSLDKPVSLGVRRTLEHERN